MRRLLTILCGLALTGCGGGGEMSQKEFRAEGARICEAGGPVTDAGAVGDTMKKLEVLEAPQSVRPHVEKLASGTREIAELLPRVAGSGLEGQQALRRINFLIVETGEAANAAGLPACIPKGLRY
jgi:hypothetical protein